MSGKQKVSMKNREGRRTRIGQTVLEEARVVGGRRNKRNRSRKRWKKKAKLSVCSNELTQPLEECRGGQEVVIHASRRDCWCRRASLGGCLNEEEEGRCGATVRREEKVSKAISVGSAEFDRRVT
jgi:hypothetical protein